MICAYSDEKREAIKNLDNLAIYRFLDQIQEGRKILNENILEPFVPKQLKNSKDNSKKYGLQTKERFVEALKGNLEGWFSDSKNKKRVTPEDKVFIMLPEILLIWAKNNFLYFEKIMNNYKEKYGKESEIDLLGKDFFEFLLIQNQELLISRETLFSYYRFTSFIDKDIEKRLKNCKSRLDILKDIKKKINNISEEELNKNIEELSKLQELLKTKEDENESLINEINSQKEDIYELQDQIKVLSEKQNFSNNTDIEKMKENLNNKIKEKDNKINELEYKLDEYSSFEQKNEELLDKINSLEKMKNFNIRQLRSDLNYSENVKTLKEIVFSDKNLLNSFIDVLNLKDEILNKNIEIIDNDFNILKNEVSELTEQRNQLDTEIKQLKQDKIYYEQNANSLNVNNIISDTVPTSNQPKLKLFENNTNKNLKETLIDNDIFDEDDFDKLQNAQILISTKCTDYNNWKKNGNVTFKPLIVSVNYDWTSYKDWFGYFDSNNTFKPATTLIADYYNFVNDNENIPFGVVVFKDFNKIMPEIYLEEFFGNIQLNGYIDLIHPLNSISNEDYLYSRIEKENLFNQLKFVLIKSNDEDAFEIKDSFIKSIGAKYAE